MRVCDICIAPHSGFRAKRVEKCMPNEIVGCLLTDGRISCNQQMAKSQVTDAIGCARALVAVSIEYIFSTAGPSITHLTGSEVI